MNQQTIQRFVTKCKCGNNLEDFNSFLCKECKKEFYRELTKEEKDGVQFIAISPVLSSVKKVIKVKGGL